jgi:hypothetical protein
MPRLTGGSFDATVLGFGALAMTVYAGQAAEDEKAPATFKVKFDSSAGPFVVEVTRAWAPNAADPSVVMRSTV